MKWQISRVDTYSKRERDRKRAELKNVGFELTDQYGLSWEYTNENLKITVILTAREA